MAIIASNGLYGTDGVQPDGTSIAATGDAPTFLDNTRLLYDDTHLVRGRVPIQFSTGYRRTSTGRIRFDLPATGPWSARWYVWMPDLQDAGLGIDEVRWHVGFPDTGLGYVTHTTAAGNAGTRLQPADLDQSAIIWDVEDGSAVAADQLWRVELFYDGTDLTSHVYAGNDTVSPRIHVWNNRDVGRTLELTAYRYRRDAFLPYGNGAFDQEVQDYQNFLIDLGYPAPLFGADGFYGDEMAGQLDDFAGDFGFSDLIGTFGSGGGAGAEVLAGIDLAWQEDQAVATPSPLWIGNFTVTDTGTTVGPLDLEDTDVAASVSVAGAATAENTSEDATVNLAASTAVSGAAQASKNTLADEAAEVAVSGAAETSRSTGVDEAASVAVDGDVTLFKETSTPPLAAAVGVSGSVFVTAGSLIPDPPRVPPQARLAVYDPDGDRRGILPHTFSWEASFPLNDVGAMRLSYSRLAPGADILEQVPFEIAVEINDGAGSFYIERPSSRFISLQIDEDETDRTKTVQVTLANYGWMLRKGKISSQIVDGEAIYTDVNVGDVFTDALANKMISVTFVGLNLDFNGTTDSSGVVWSHPDFDVSYPAGTDLDSIQQSFTDEGLIDWRFNGRDWQVYNAGGGMQRDMTDDIRLRLHGVALEAPKQWRYDDFARAIVVRWEGGNVLGFQGPTINWGAWGDFINMTGDANLASAQAVRDVRLEETNDPRVQRTRRYLVDGIQPVPLWDYLPGDLVVVEDGENSTGITQRVHQITLSHGSDRILKTNITLGDRFTYPDVRQRKRLNQVTNRASKILGAGVGRNLT